MLIETEIKEIALPTSFFKILLSLKVLILGSNFMAGNRMKILIYDMLLAKLETEVIWCCAAFAAFLFATKAFLMIPNKSSEVHARTLQVSVVTTCIFSHLVAPFAVMVTSKALAESLLCKATGAQIGKASVLIVLLIGLICLSLAVEAARLTLPTYAYTSTLAQSTRSSFMLLCTAVQITCAFRDALPPKQGDFTAFLSLSLVSSVFLGVSLYLVVYSRLFWNLEANKQVFCGMARVTLLKLVTESAIGLVEKPFAWAFIFLALQPLAEKLADRLDTCLARVNIFDKSLSPHRFYFGVGRMNQVLCSEYEACETDHERELFVFYLGIWHSEYNKNLLRSLKLKSGLTPQPATEVEAQERRQIRKRFQVCLLIEYISDLKWRNEEVCKMLCMLQVTQMLSYFRTARPLHENFRSFKASDLLSTFEVYQIQTMWESRMQALERGVIQVKDTSTSSIFETIDYISQSIQLLKSKTATDYIDTKRTFESVERFDQLWMAVDAVVLKQCSIFEELFEESRATAALLRQLNTATFDGKEKVNSLIHLNSVYDDNTNLYSYFYPTIIFYFSQVAYNLSKADKFTQLYKRKLSGLFVSSSYRKQQISNMGMEIDSVALQVSLEKDNLALITKISPNANHFLGPNAETYFLNKTVNSFLPGVLAEEHLKIIESEKIHSIINRSRLVFLNDLNGHLKHAYLFVKIAPSVIQNIAAFTLLSFNTHRKAPSFILDADFNIVGADTKHSSLFRALSEAKKDKSGVALADLCPKLSCAVKTLDKIFTYFQKSLQPEAAQSGNISNKLIRDKLFSLLQVIIEENDRRGLVYDLMNESVLSLALNKVDLHVQVKFDIVMNNKIIKLYTTNKSNKTKRLMSSRVLGKVSRDPWNRHDASDDAETNKAIKEDIHDAANEYNSEHKDSLLCDNKSKRPEDNRSNFGTDSDDDRLESFKRLLVPAGEFMEMATRLLTQQLSSKHHNGDQGQNRKSVTSLEVYAPGTEETRIEQIEITADMKALIATINETRAYLSQDLLYAHQLPGMPLIKRDMLSRDFAEADHTEHTLNRAVTEQLEQEKITLPLETRNRMLLEMSKKRGPIMHHKKNKSESFGFISMNKKTPNRPYGQTSEKDSRVTVVDLAKSVNTASYHLIPRIQSIMSVAFFYPREKKCQPSTTKKIISLSPVQSACLQQAQRRC
jgi:hypothetical protein